MAKTLHVINDIPSRYSTSEQWKLWHEALKKEFGRDRANNLWLEAWSKRGDNDANDEELRTYLAKQGVSLEKDWADAAVDFGAGVVGSVGDIFATIRRNMMIMAIIALVIVVGVLLAVMKNPELVKTVASFTPAGRAGKLTGKL